jgi:small subunit ribosomal protein S18
MVVKNTKYKSNAAQQKAPLNPKPDADGFIKVSLVNQSVFIRKKKSCPLRDITIPEINYTDLRLLNKFLSERGKIIPSRVTNVIVKKQKALANAIKRARHLALISPVKKDLISN